MVINQLPNGMILQVPSMYGVPNMPYKHPMGVMFVDFCLYLGGLFQRFAEVVFFWGMIALQGTTISHLGKRKIIFKMPFLVGYVSSLQGMFYQNGWLNHQLVDELLAFSSF